MTLLVSLMIVFFQFLEKNDVFLGLCLFFSENRKSHSFLKSNKISIRSAAKPRIKQVEMLLTPPGSLAPRGHLNPPKKHTYDKIHYIYLVQSSKWRNNLHSLMCEVCKEFERKREKIRD